MLYIIKIQKIKFICYILKIKEIVTKRKSDTRKSQQLSMQSIAAHLSLQKSRCIKLLHL